MANALEKDYEILKQLGEGAFGKVYKAKHRGSADIVAVKQIKVGSKSWDEALKSTELAALRALRHPCIVRLKELIRSPLDGSLYYIFDFCSSDLFRLLRNHPQGLEEARALDFQRQIFAGLAHVHTHNFFHRDIKPENILYDEDRDAVCIADFGEARSLRSRPPFTDYVGTRWYRAPESLLRDTAYSSPVDVWAAGLVFAELFRGTPVFCGSSSMDQLYRIWQVFNGQPVNDWPEFTRLSEMCRFRVPKESGCGLHRVLPPHISHQVATFIGEVLRLNPRRRPSARKCMEHPVFSQRPPLDLEALGARRPSRPNLEETLLPDTGRSRASSLAQQPQSQHGPTSSSGGLRPAAPSWQEDLPANDRATPPPPGEGQPPPPPRSDAGGAGPSRGSGGGGCREAQGSSGPDLDDLDLDLDLDAELDKILSVDSPKRHTPAPASSWAAASAVGEREEPAGARGGGGASREAEQAAPRHAAGAPAAAANDRSDVGGGGRQPVGISVTEPNATFSWTGELAAASALLKGTSDVQLQAAERNPNLASLVTPKNANSHQQRGASPSPQSPGFGSVDALFQSLYDDLGVDPQQRQAAGVAGAGQAGGRAGAGGKEPPKQQPMPPPAAAAVWDEDPPDAAAAAGGRRLSKDGAGAGGGGGLVVEGFDSSDAEEEAEEIVPASSLGATSLVRALADSRSLGGLGLSAAAKDEKVKKPPPPLQASPEADQGPELAAKASFKEGSSFTPKAGATFGGSLDLDLSLGRGATGNLFSGLPPSGAGSGGGGGGGGRGERPSSAVNQAGRLLNASTTSLSRSASNPLFNASLVSASASGAALGGSIGGAGYGAGAAHEDRPSASLLDSDGADARRADSSKASGALWSREESEKLKKTVKRIMKRGLTDKEALWVEVAEELGGGRGARECKKQYAREYKAHKAASTASADGAPPEDGRSDGPTKKERHRSSSMSRTASTGAAPPPRYASEGIVGGERWS